MPSRADAARAKPAGGATAAPAAAVEAGLRVIAFALIAFAIWRVVGAGDGERSIVARASSLAHDLPSIEAAHPAAVHVTMDGPTAPAERDALAAVAHAGTRVSWSGTAIPALAVVAERAREPGGPVHVAMTSGDAVALADGLAPLDTVGAPSAAAGATVSVGAPSGALTARSGAARAPIGVPAVPPLHPVLVVGRAGWEAKFVVAALEEAGWSADTRLFVAPNADVTQGAGVAIDTSRYSAIVALDTVLGSAGPRISAFVREGGGLILLASAASARDVRAIAPAAVGTRRISSAHAFDVAAPVNAMPVYPLESVRADAVPLATRGPLVTSAARREGAGRVLQVAFDETWRWRMQGGVDAVAAHRAWWSRMVGSVAAVSPGAADQSNSAEGAPLARLVDALGPATSATATPSTPRPLPAWLLPALLICLLGEWGSRRWRGAA